MDTISQALWGAICSEGTQKKKKGKVPAWVIGLAAGTAPDLDTFLKSASDPLFSTLIHRHFTHSIFFIPFGALIVWFLFWPFFRKEKELYSNYYLISVAGYGTHWILDVLTSYGTLIFWPITDRRYSLDWVSIVDPLATIPWIFALGFFVWKKNRKWISGILIYSLVYFSFCGVLHSQAVKAFEKYATQNNINYERVRLLPTLLNSFWYRAVAANDADLHAAGIFVHPFTFEKFFRPGESRPRWFVPIEFQSKPEVLRQVEIWKWFTDDFMYLEKNDPLEVGDGRYSTQAAGFSSLWILRVNPERPQETLKTMPTFSDTTESRSPLEGYQLLFEQKDLVRLSQ